MRNFLTSKEGGSLETSDAAEIASTIGGQLKDLRAITHAIVTSSERKGEERCEEGSEEGSEERVRLTNF